MIRYILVPFIAIISIWMLFTSCTISLQNISTNGRAEDVVDENMKAEADISPDVNTSLVP